MLFSPPGGAWPVLAIETCSGRQKAGVLAEAEGAGAFSFCATHSQTRRSGRNPENELNPFFSSRERLHLYFSLLERVRQGNFKYWVKQSLYLQTGKWKGVPVLLNSAHSQCI